MRAEDVQRLTRFTRRDVEPPVYFLRLQRLVEALGQPELRGCAVLAAHVRVLPVDVSPEHPRDEARPVVGDEKRCLLQRAAQTLGRGGRRIERGGAIKRTLWSSARSHRAQ